jgi:hypothetical protein
MTVLTMRLQARGERWQLYFDAVLLGDPQLTEVMLRKPVWESLESHQRRDRSDLTRLANV